MSDFIQIENIGDYAGQTVKLRGWLYNRTDKGKLQFLLLRDGTGTVQCVVFQKDVSEDLFAAAGSLTQESSFVVEGEVRADERAPGIPGGYEVGVKSLEVLQVAAPYPITPKEHGPEFLLDNRHLWLRSARQWAIMRVRHTVIKAARNWLDDNGYLNVDTPIISATAGENTTTLFEVDYFGDPAYLAQTGQLYSEANIGAFGKVYCFGPTFRAEKSKTRRHLTEFWMLEPEMAFFNLEDLMDMQEVFFSHIVQTVINERAEELKVLERDISRLENITVPFDRISYDDAVALVEKLRGETDDAELKEMLKMEWGEDFGSPHETAIANHFDKPVFVYHYPTAAKAFYMTPVEGRPEVCRSVDLLAPDGYGEITGGSERIHDFELIKQRVEDFGISPEAYKWYLELRTFGSVPHAGFGMGLERTVAWICGTPHIRETIPFPRMLNRAYP